MVEPDSGPDSPHVPKLPPGWIAQWDSSSRKYYYVQISTGKSTWEKPTTAAPGVVTISASSTPAQGTPYTPPPINTMSGEHEGTRGLGDGESTERGFGTTAFNMIAGSSNNKQNNNLVGQLASGLLGGNKPGNSGSSGSGGFVGQLASGILGGGNKPQQQQQYGGSGYSGGGSGQSGSGGGLIGGIVGGILGHGHHGQQQNFGYSHTGQTGPYTGEEPPAEYKPANHSSGSQLGQQYGGQQKPPHHQGNEPYQQPSYGQGQGSQSFGQQGQPYGQNQSNSPYPGQNQSPYPQQPPSSYESRPQDNAYPHQPGQNQYQQSQYGQGPPHAPQGQQYGSSSSTYGQPTGAPGYSPNQYGQQHGQGGFGGSPYELQGQGNYGQQNQQHQTPGSYPGQQPPQQPGW